MCIRDRGNTDKALPIDVKVTYALDGQEAALEDIIGKSGHLTVTVNLKNNEKMCIRDRCNAAHDHILRTAEHHLEVLRLQGKAHAEHHDAQQVIDPVSYTHLDVYKRQVLRSAGVTISQ